LATEGRYQQFYIVNNRRSKSVVSFLRSAYQMAQERQSFTSSTTPPPFDHYSNTLGQGERLISNTNRKFDHGHPTHSTMPTKHRIWRVRDGWLGEIACLVLSIAAFAALVGILAAYHNHPLSTFGTTTSINAVISILVTVSEFCLLYPVAEAICQQKWLHMHRSQTLGRPLMDLQRFDRAAHSGFAALDLLGHGLSYGPVVLLGAFAIIAHLLIGPFAQQAVSYPTRSAPVLDNYENATIVRAESYDGDCEWRSIV